ncbi:MAG: UDP-N-acetylglucosamine--N-acetylmuramyl-(pentapeptide) pyrophosphoryl-undecaprenol N-acetylglucosamine transferase, partial [Francisellaceae bacterium]
MHQSIKNDDAKLAGKSIMIMAGGTGGHIFPALAVARDLGDKGASIRWLGTRYGLEKKLVEGLFPIDYLMARGLRRRGVWPKIKFPFQLMTTIIQALWLFKKHKTRLVVGFGGYASGPGALAAKLMGMPVIIHEQNAQAGMTNRMLAKIAKEVLVAFPTRSFDRNR